MTKIDHSMMSVTPKLAAQWLDLNKTNRSLRPGVVEQYAKDMAAGRWTHCTAPIAFYADGDLADGQHRLWAVVESETTQQFIVVRGLSREDGLNIDTGLGRTVVDNGRISGLDTGLSHSLIATARAVHTGMPSAGRLSNAEKLDIVNEHREAANWALSKLVHTKNVYNSASLGAIARAWYWEADKERLEKFAHVLGTGYSDGDADSAAVCVRNYMLANAGQAASTPMWRDTFLKVQNAIHYFMKRQRLTVIKSVKEEAYPLKKRRAAKK